MYCKYCGQDLQNGQDHHCEQMPFLKKAILWFFDRSGVENPFRGANEMYERERQITPDCLDLDDGEIPVKQYNIGILRSRLRFQRSEGRLQITNKRVLFRATGYSPAGKTTYQHAFALDKIDGIEIHKDRRLRIPDLIFVLLWASMGYMFATLITGLLAVCFLENEFLGYLLSLTVFGIGCATGANFFIKKEHFFSKMILLSVGKGAILSLSFFCFEAAEKLDFLGVFMLAVAFLLEILYCICAFLVVIKPNLMIEVKTSSGTPAVQIKHREMSLFWHKHEEFSGFTEILPWKDTDLAIKEVSTIIDDIKTLGDFGVDKWKQD